MKQAKLKFYVIAHGKKKRARLVDRHMIKLGYLPLDVEAEGLFPECFEAIKKHMRETSQAFLHLDYVEIEDNGSYQVETWKPFDDRHRRYTLIDNMKGNQTA